MLYLAVIVLLAPPQTVDLKADRLEISRTQWDLAGDVLLTTGPYRITAHRLGGKNHSDCKGGLVIFDRLTVEGSRRRVQLQGGDYCPRTERFNLTQIQLRFPRFRFESETVSGRLDSRAHIRSGRATNGVVTTCNCQDPPWEVHFRKAEFSGEEGVWAEWPVFYAGGVPIAAVPTWYFPSNHRQSGLLWPRLGWRSQNGLTLAQPFFWAVDEARDLTLELGIRGTDTRSGRARFRWATPWDQVGYLDAQAVGESLRLTGRGAYRFAPLHTAAHIDWLDAPLARPLFTTDWREARRFTWTSRLGLWVEDTDIAAGVLARLGQGHDQAPSDTPTLHPTVWFQWSPDFGPLALQLNATGHYARLETAEVFAADGRLTSSVTHWLGPLRLRWSQVGWAGIASDGESPEVNALYGRAGLDLDIIWQRRYPVTHHSIRLGLDTYLDRMERPGLVPRIDLWSASFERRSVGLHMEHRMSRRGTTAALQIRQGLSIGPERIAPEPLEVDLRADGRLGQIMGRGIGTSFAWLRGDIRINDALRLGGTAAYASSTSSTAWVSRVETLGFYRLKPGFGHSTGLGPHTALRAGPLRVMWSGMFGQDDLRWVGHRGTVAWTGRCGCWYGEIALNHDARQPRPDLLINFKLTTP